MFADSAAVGYVDVSIMLVMLMIIMVAALTIVDEQAVEQPIGDRARLYLYSSNIYLNRTSNVVVASDYVCA